MRKKFIEILICPLCRRSLYPENPGMNLNNEIQRGFLKCSCRAYPVLEGIPILSPNPTRKRIERFLIKYEERLKGKEIPFFLFQRNIPNSLIFFLSRTGFLANLSLRQFLLMLLLTGAIKPRWYLYLTRRVSASINSAAKLPLPGDKIIDLGCGPGHLLSKLKNPFKLGVDFNLLNLYLAKKYLTPASGLVYADLNRPLPIMKKVFDIAVVNDAFHYVKAQKLLGGEIKRILKTDGLVFLGHVHNLRVIPHLSAYPVTLSECRRLFKQFKMSSYREGERYLIPVDMEKSEKLTFLNLLFARGRSPLKLFDKIPKAVFFQFPGMKPDMNPAHPSFKVL